MVPLVVTVLTIVMAADVEANDGGDFAGSGDGFDDGWGAFLIAVVGWQARWLC
jgi:hypothetical protein